MKGKMLTRAEREERVQKHLKRAVHALEMAERYSYRQREWMQEHTLALQRAEDTSHLSILLEDELNPMIEFKKDMDKRRKK